MPYTEQEMYRGLRNDAFTHTYAKQNILVVNCSVTADRHMLVICILINDNRAFSHEGFKEYFFANTSDEMAGFGNGLLATRL